MKSRHRNGALRAAKPFMGRQRMVYSGVKAGFLRLRGPLVLMLLSCLLPSPLTANQAASRAGNSTAYSCKMLVTGWFGCSVRRFW
jgi:hypothetical protein